MRWKIWKKQPKHRNTIMICGKGNGNQECADSLVQNTLYIQRSGKICSETRTKIRRSVKSAQFPLASNSNYKRSEKQKKTKRAYIYLKHYSRATF